MKKLNCNLNVCICIFFIVFSIVFCIDVASAQRLVRERRAMQNRVIPTMDIFCTALDSYNAPMSVARLANGQTPSLVSVSGRSQGHLGFTQAGSMLVGYRCESGNSKLGESPQLWSMGACYGLVENYPPDVVTGHPSLIGNGLLDCVYGAEPQTVTRLCGGYGGFGGYLKPEGGIDARHIGRYGLWPVCSLYCRKRMGRCRMAGMFGGLGY